MTFSFGPPVEEADVRTTTAGLEADPSSVLVDVREADEWDEVRAPNARHIPMGEIPQHLENLPRSAPVYLICRSGSRSETVAAYLKRAGFERPINVAGGMIAWEQAGLPVERRTT